MATIRRVLLELDRLGGAVDRPWVLCSSQELPCIHARFMVQALVLEVDGCSALEARAIRVAGKGRSRAMRARAVRDGGERRLTVCAMERNLAGGVHLALEWRWRGPCCGWRHSFSAHEGPHKGTVMELVRSPIALGCAQGANVAWGKPM